MNMLRTILVALLIMLPITLVGWVVLTYSFNLPYWDDFLVQENLLLLKQSAGLEKVIHFFDQHWEHRIVWTRLVFAAFAKLNGTLNYYGLTLIGFSGLLAALGILFANFKSLHLPLFYFVPIPFWLFSLQSHENLIWAMASIQNFWVLVFALGTFYSLAQNTYLTRWLALGLAVLATFTSGNGALVLISGLLVILAQRHWRFTLVWLVTTLLAIIGYFYNYTRITFFPSPFKYPFIDWIKAFFIFLGAFADPYPYSATGAVGYENPLGLIMIIGAAIMGLATYFAIHELKTTLLKGFHLENKSAFFVGCLLFILGTATITVYSRVGFSGPAYLLQGRYKVYSALALSVVYLYSLSAWEAKSFRLTYALGIGILTIGQSLFADYFCLEGIINQHRRTVSEYFNYVVDTPLERQQAIKQVFVPSKLPFFNGNTDQLSAAAWWSAPATTKLGHIDNQPFMYNITKSVAVNPTLATPDYGSYIYVKSPVKTYLFAARPMRPSPLALSGFAHYFTADRFFAQVLKEKLEPGRYRLGILTYQNNSIRLAMTSQYITFASF